MHVSEDMPVRHVSVFEEAISYNGNTMILK